MNVSWPRPTAKALAALPPDAAQRVRAAVERYAETGHGDVLSLFALADSASPAAVADPYGVEVLI